jgi:hypothetical protein
MITEQQGSLMRLAGANGRVYFLPNAVYELS